MKRFHSWTCLAALTLAFFAPSAVRAQQDDIEVLARGPVHEAYANTIDQSPDPGPIIAREPPNPIEELPPDERPEGDNVVWIPGYWSWDDERSDFVWVSGFWRVPPPGKAWVPGTWRATRQGYQWVGGFWIQPQLEQQIEYLPPPPPPVETAPTLPAPTATCHYVPGCWVWRNTRYLWRPGYWIEHRPGWVWIPAHYRWTPAGYVYIAGYWDYPLAARGVLFAPIYVSPVVYRRPNFFYQPTYVVRDDCMYGALFVRRSYGHYYFGDYFDRRYLSAGFVAWNGSSSIAFSATTVRREFHYDPLFSYYRVDYRNDAFWQIGMTDLYVARYRGVVAPPPRTLVQQNIVINNITNNTIVNNVQNNVQINPAQPTPPLTGNNIRVNPQVNQVAMLTPLKSLPTASPSKPIRLQRMDPLVQKEQLSVAKSFTEAAKQRAVIETQLQNHAVGIGKPFTQPIQGKIALPKPIVDRAIATEKPTTPPIGIGSPPQPNKPLVPTIQPNPSTPTKPDFPTQPSLKPTPPVQPTLPNGTKPILPQPTTPNGKPNSFVPQPQPLQPIIPQPTPPSAKPNAPVPLSPKLETPLRPTVPSVQPGLPTKPTTFPGVPTKPMVKPTLPTPNSTKPSSPLSVPEAKPMVPSTIPGTKPGLPPPTTPKPTNPVISSKPTTKPSPKPEPEPQKPQQ